MFNLYGEPCAVHLDYDYARRAYIFTIICSTPIFAVPVLSRDVLQYKATWIRQIVTRQGTKKGPNNSPLPSLGNAPKHGQLML